LSRVAARGGWDRPDPESASPSWRTRHRCGRMLAQTRPMELRVPSSGRGGPSWVAPASGRKQRVTWPASAVASRALGPGHAAWQAAGLSAASPGRRGSSRASAASSRPSWPSPPRSRPL